MNTIETKLRSDLKEAMKAKDSQKVLVLRSVIASLDGEKINKKLDRTAPLPENDEMAILKREASKRVDAIEQFKKGNREDLAQNEEAELHILKAYLPEMMSDDELRTIVETKATELGATDPSKMGILIGAVMKEAGARADGKAVSRLVQEFLKKA